MCPCPGRGSAKYEVPVQYDNNITVWLPTWSLEQNFYAVQLWSITSYKAILELDSDLSHAALATSRPSIKELA